MMFALIAAVSLSSVPLNPAAISKTLAAHKKDYISCVSKLAQVNASESLTVTLTIDPTGAVTSVELDNWRVAQSALGICVTKVSRAVTFPKFDGEPVMVELPLTLSTK